MIEFRAATPQEKLVRDEVTFAEWGTRLTLEQYRDREVALRAHPWSRQAMTTWFLLEGDQILSSCETFCMDSSVGSVPGKSYAVATVFTEAHLRGKGHASRLMSALVAKLREEPLAQSSVLFSDVDAPIYEESGYRPVPAFDWVLPPGEFPLEAQWLEAPVPAPPRGVSGKGQLLFHPSAEQLDWHFERSRLYSRFLDVPPLSHFGARTARATAWWTAQHKSNELLILWLEAPDARAAAPVLRAAQLQAHRLGLPKVRVWETLSLAGLSGAVRTPRDGELPMVASLNATCELWVRVERALWV